MTTATSEGVSKSDTTLKITRLFDAAPERVFDAWLDADQVARWMGPRTMVAECETLLLEPRVGGRYEIRMRKADGSATTASGAYLEMVRPSRLVMTWGWDRNAECGRSGPASSPLGEFHETLITLTFRPVGKQTEMTIVHENFPDADRRDRHQYGWSCSFDQLAEFLEGKR